MQRYAAAFLVSILSQFLSAPPLGPYEPGPTPKTWPETTTAPIPARPGNGLAQRSMLFAGEGYNTIFLVHQGKVAWSYSAGRGGEIDDVWMLSNGHVLYAKQFKVEEITPKKEIVWHYDVPPGTEIHSAQPIGLDKVLLVQNGLPPKAIIINKNTGAVEMEHALPAESETDPRTVHAQFRRIRMTAAGTYLLPFLRMNKVIEYDKSWNPIWSYDISTPWAAVRLHNGNTMIVDERERIVREVNSKGETAWEFTQKDLPPDVAFHNIQTADRLENGNTVIFSSTGGSTPEQRPEIIQAIEVTPAKKIVWVLQDWKALGPATTAQFLDQPGTPEKPGDLMH